MKLSRRDRNLLVFMSVFVAVALFYQFIFQPAMERGRGLTQRREAKEVELKKAQRAVRGRARLERDLMEVKVRLNYAKDRLPEAKDVPALLKQIEKIAKDSKVDVLKSLRFDTTEEAEFYRTIPIQLSMECNSKALARFLYQIETSSRLLDIEKLRISSDPKANLRVDMTLATFVYKPGVAR